MHILGRIISIVILIYIHPIWRIYMIDDYDEEYMNIKIKKIENRRKLFTQRLKFTPQHN